MAQASIAVGRTRPLTRGELGQRARGRTGEPSLLDSLRGFVAQLRRERESLEENVRVQHVQAINTLFEKILTRNPFLYGQSKSKWIVSLDSPQFVQTPYNRVNPTTRQNAEDTARNNSNPALNDFQLGNQFFLSNSAPYITNIEARYGFISLGLAETEGRFNNLQLGPTVSAVVPGS